MLPPHIQALLRDAGLFPPTCGTVLLVDDEPSNLAVLEAVLDAHWEVLVASGGEEALRILREHPSVDVVIADQRMPGMTGVDLLARVARRWPDIVRIVLTGYSDLEPMVEAINEGAVYRFLVKPFNPVEMQAVVAEALQVRETHLARVLVAEHLAARRAPPDVTRRAHPGDAASWAAIANEATTLAALLDALEEHTPGGDEVERTVGRVREALAVIQALRGGAPLLPHASPLELGGGPPAGPSRPVPVWISQRCGDLACVLPPPVQVVTDVCRRLDAEGPAVLVLDAEDLRGPRAEHWLTLAARALPGRPVVRGGEDDRDLLVAAINQWRAFCLVPTALPEVALAEAVARARAACAAELDLARRIEGLRPGRPWSAGGGAPGAVPPGSGELAASAGLEALCAALEDLESVMRSSGVDAEMAGVARDVCRRLLALREAQGVPGEDLVQPQEPE